MFDRSSVARGADIERFLDELHQLQDPGQRRSGGVPVAWEVAAALDAPLDTFVVRKLGVPGHDEFAMGALASGGAIASGGAVGLNDDLLRDLAITPQETQGTFSR